MSKTVTASGNIGFFGLLTIAFITLKLCNVIAWSWLWVLSPLWIPLALILAIFIASLIFLIIKEIIGSLRKKKPRR